MKKNSTASLCLVITAVSLVGFVIENIWLAITCGYVNNRNMIFPFLYGYGLAVAVIYIIFGTPTEPKFLSYRFGLKSKFARLLVYFLMICIIVSIGEHTLGTVVEKACGLVWWNYTGIPLAITKYTSVPTTLLFSLLITLFMKCAFIPTQRFFFQINSKTSAWLAGIFITIMTLDFIHSGIVMMSTGYVLEIWRIPPL